MSPILIIVGIAAAALVSLLYSTLTYSLRDFSRAQLTGRLEQAGRPEYAERTIDHAHDLIFVTAVGRLLGNVLVLIGCLRLLHDMPWSLWLQYFVAVLLTLGITLFVSVAIPHAIARHASEAMITAFVVPVHWMRALLLPIVKLMQLTDALVRRAASGSAAPEPDQIEEEIEQEILSAVEEGEKEGVVDEEEREMIESVIEFHDTQVGQIMTPRPEIFAVDVNATLQNVQSKIRESGHSRIPVYEGNIDHVIGVIYARDLLKLIGSSESGNFSVRKMMRPPLFVPETKPLHDLLQDFRLQKVHIAIVLDEYGGTAGLVTIEDILEELVGDISDEHEPAEPAMLVRVGDSVAEADARIYISELNRILGLNLPEDAGYDTLGGFISTALGRIPEPGASFEHNHARYTILDAEPQKVNRVQIELLPVPTEEHVITGK